MESKKSNKGKFSQLNYEFCGRAKRDKELHLNK